MVDHNFRIRGGPTPGSAHVDSRAPMPTAMPTIMPTAKISAGYLGYPDFNTAVAWYGLFGRPQPDLDLLPDFGQYQDDEDENETETDASDRDNSSDESDQPAEDSDEGDDYDRQKTDEEGDEKESASDKSPGSEEEDIDSGEDDPSRSEDGEGSNEDQDQDQDLEVEIEGETDVEGESEAESEAADEGPRAEYGLDNAPDLPKIIPGFWTSIDPNGRFIVNREFKSWFDFVASAADPNLFAWTKTGKRLSHQDGDISVRHEIKGWYGTDSFEQAIDMALRSGWPEGRRLLTNMLIAVATRPQVRDAWMFEVAGAFPCVPVYCAGDPACMILDLESEQKSARPIVRIDYANGAGWTVGVEAMMLRGAAVLSFANSLEERGFSTELRIVNASKSDPRSKDAQIIRYSITYKPAGEALDIDRAAFALAHPSTFRRLAFAIYEQHLELEDEFHKVYGYSMHEPNDPTSGQPGGAIFIDGAQNGETVDSARRAVEIAAEKAGFAPDKFADAAN